jgi:glycosyltransferase involved in cell wall biosynthesis
MKTKISVVVPVRNEAEHIVPFYYELIKYLPASYELIWVNDSSEDATMQEIEALSFKDERIKCIVLQKEFGIETAVMAGLDYATGTNIVVMKGDMQHPPEMIPRILEQLEDSSDIVNTHIINKFPVHQIQQWLMDCCYHIVKKFSARDEISDITELRGFKKNVINDLLRLREKQFFPESYFDWSVYTMHHISYENRKTTRDKVRYTREHFTHNMRYALKNAGPGLIKTLLVFGATLSIAGLFFIVLFLIEYYKGNPVYTGALSLTSLLFAGGLQIFVYSSYRKKLKSELFKLCRNHQYIVKNILDPDPVLSEYGYLGNGKRE